LALTIGSGADIQGAALCDELLTIQSSVKKRKNPTPLNILNVMKKFNMEDLRPIICVYLGILLTIPVSIASSESFSGLKLVKTYLRPFMSQKYRAL
jgi:hypothetical protein